MVSRNVFFDETKGWNWKQEISERNQVGNFKVTLGTFGNHGIHTDECKETEQCKIEMGSSAVKENVTIEENDTASEDEQENGDPPVLRRSERLSTKPKYLDDYVLVAEYEGERLLLSLNDEPRSFQEARELREWILACEDEIQSITKLDCWSLVDLPQGVEPVGLKWVFKIKRNADGSINKYKACLVAKGYVQQHGVDYEEVFAPVARIETIRLLINLAASYG